MVTTSQWLGYLGARAALGRASKTLGLPDMTGPKPRSPRIERWTTQRSVVAAAPGSRQCSRRGAHCDARHELFEMMNPALSHLRLSAICRLTRLASSTCHPRRSSVRRSCGSTSRPVESRSARSRHWLRCCTTRTNGSPLLIIEHDLRGSPRSLIVDCARPGRCPRRGASV